MVARIFRPAKSAMQSGRAKTGRWMLVYDQDAPTSVEPLMGYTSSADMKQQIKLAFDTAEEAVGRPVTIIAIPGREGEMADIVARIRRGERVEHYETERRHKNGAIVPVSLTVSPIHDKDGRVIGASKIARDISDRRRADRQLRLLMGEIDHRAAFF